MSRLLPASKLTLPLSLFALGIVVGIVIQRYGLFARAKQLLTASATNECSPPCSSQRCCTILALGQSNAANYGDVRSSGGPGTYAFYDGKYYGCNDPIPGAGGDGGSVWSRVASRLLLETDRECCIVCTLAQGSTSVADWRPEGPLFQRAAASAHRLRDDGFPISAVVWHQGETDAASQTSARRYLAHLQEMIQGLRDQAIDAPIFICIASRGHNGCVFEPVRLAQQAVVDAPGRVYPGCDTDLLDERFRWDGIHFNLRGLDAFAQGLINRFVETALVERIGSGAEARRP